MKTLFIQSGSSFQLIRALSFSFSNHLDPIFIIPKNQLNEYKSLSLKYDLPLSHIEYQFPIDSPQFKNIIHNVVSQNQIEKAYIIISPPSKIRFVENEYSMDINASYPIVRALHANGVHRIGFINSNSVLERNVDSLLDDYKHFGIGKRCFIVGNGPSLNQIQMNLLKNEITFGCNRCYLGFEDWGFQFNFWAVIDRIQIEHHLSEWEHKIPKETVKLFPFEYFSIFNFQNACPVYFTYEEKGFPRFSTDSSIVYLGFTTIHFLIQIAVIMGFQKIILVGVDNRYHIPPEKIVNDRWTDENSQNHFHKDYCENGKRVFVPPRTEKSNAAYEHASQFCMQNHIEVLNASPGSALDAFPLVNFNHLFI